MEYIIDVCCCQLLQSIGGSHNSPLTSLKQQYYPHKTQKEMLKNFSKLVNSKTLTTPNNLLLHQTLPAPLIPLHCIPSLQHIYPLPSMLKHIVILNSYKIEQQKSSEFEDEIKETIAHLMANLKVSANLALTYVRGGGYLTPQAIADLYDAEEHLKGYLSDADEEIFFRGLEEQAKKAVNSFSVGNLYSILNKLDIEDKKHKELIALLSGELQKRDLTPLQEVLYDVNSTTTYTYKQPEPNDKQYSRNPLIHAVVRKQNYFTYRYKALWTYATDYLKYFQQPVSLYRLDPPEKPKPSDLKKLLIRLDLGKQ